MVLFFLIFVFVSFFFFIRLQVLRTAACLESSMHVRVCVCVRIFMSVCVCVHQCWGVYFMDLCLWVVFFASESLSRFIWESRPSIHPFAAFSFHRREWIGVGVYLCGRVVVLVFFYVFYALKYKQTRGIETAAAKRYTHTVTLIATSEWAEYEKLHELISSVAICFWVFVNRCWELVVEAIFGCERNITDYLRH